MTTTTATATSATERAAMLEQKIRDLHAERAACVANAPTTSARDVALAMLGENGANAPTPADFGKHEDNLALLDARLAGLQELRVELEPAVIAEKLASVDEQLKTANARRAPIIAKLDDMKKEQDRLEREAAAGQDEVARLRQAQHAADVALRQVKRGERSQHFEDLFDRIGAPQELRATTRRRLSNPVSVAHRRGDATSLHDAGILAS